MPSYMFNIYTVPTGICFSYKAVMFSKSMMSAEKVRSAYSDLRKMIET